MSVGAIVSRLQLGGRVEGRMRPGFNAGFQRGLFNNGEHKMSTLQDPFLNALRKEQVPVSVYLVNGIKLQGAIDSFDQYVVILRNSVSQMIYKHAISTVVPARNVQSDLQDE